MPRDGIDRIEEVSVCVEFDDSQGVQGFFP